MLHPVLEARNSVKVNTNKRCSCRVGRCRLTATVVFDVKYSFFLACTSTMELFETCLRSNSPVVITLTSAHYIVQPHEV